jgi:hypothetical protein
MKKKRWWPEFEESFWYFDGEGSVQTDINLYGDSELFEKEGGVFIYPFGVYKTRSEALGMFKKIKAFVAKELGE